MFLLSLWFLDSWTKPSNRGNKIISLLKWKEDLPAFSHILDSKTDGEKEKKIEKMPDFC